MDASNVFGFSPQKILNLSLALFLWTLTGFNGGDAVAGDGEHNSGGESGSNEYGDGGALVVTVAEPRYSLWVLMSEKTVV
ncbi:hypothetical protein LWI29_002721 [Acer saccharum]|uniref:Uncharacterized protein n=1 Tax=Acer saccharum TaxID=4024 RepID=A0AA39SH15_ACESA|nr:hypothetical protein LWI29_002721 [Acer saccharum]